MHNFYYYFLIRCDYCCYFALDSSFSIFLLYFDRYLVGWYCICFLNFFSYETFSSFVISFEHINIFWHTCIGVWEATFLVDVFQWTDPSSIIISWFPSLHAICSPVSLFIWSIEFIHINIYLLCQDQKFVFCNDH